MPYRDNGTTCCLKACYCCSFLLLPNSNWVYLLLPLIKSFILLFKIITPRITIPDKYIRIYKSINILYKDTAFKKYDIHTNINATLSVIIIIYISQYTFSFLGHKKNNMFVYLLSFIFFLCLSISVLSVPQQTPYSNIYNAKVPNNKVNISGINFSYSVKHLPTLVDLFFF
ncbi:hypothetical protein HMPREF9099_00439 [Lachnospiraceae bacterium oral taxon 082 str. F0431]|nr:hypothetical protein HMPREF9099_00439 [Lachnospiraceae bacterium oral taxon 082 str. F0431]